MKGSLVHSSIVFIAVCDLKLLALHLPQAQVSQ
jgi:hypothetical protein